MTSEAGLLPDYPTDTRSRLIPDYPATIRSRASPGQSGLHPKLGYHSLPRLRKTFLQKPKRIYNDIWKDIWKVLLSTHKLLRLTHMIYSKHALYISPLHTVGLPPMKSENKLTFPTPTQTAPPSRGE